MQLEEELVFMRGEVAKHQETIADLQWEVQVLKDARDAALEELDKKNTEIENLSSNLKHEERTVDGLLQAEM